MSRELILNKCEKCGALVEVIKECKCNCGINCCDTPMTVESAKTNDLGFEKHVPIITVNEDKVSVKVNHIMQEDHYIEWVAYVTDKSITKVFFSPNDKPECEFDYVKDSKVYSYCNKHSLWVSDVL